MRYDEWCAFLDSNLSSAEPDVRLAFAAAIAERLLPCAESSLKSWRTEAWYNFRNGLDCVWDYLHGEKKQAHHYLNMKQKCEALVPHSEDENWNGDYGAFEGCAAIVYLLEALMSSDPKYASQVARQAFDAIRTYLVFQEYAADDVDEEVLFSSDVMQSEIQMEKKQLALLEEYLLPSHNLAAKIDKIKEESKQNPIFLR